MAAKKVAIVRNRRKSARHRAQLKAKQTRKKRLSVYRKNRMW